MPAPPRSYSLTVAEDVPCKTSLGRQKIRRCSGEYLANSWPGVRRGINNSRETPVFLSRIGVELVPQPGIHSQPAGDPDEILRETRNDVLAVTRDGNRTWWIQRPRMTEA